MIGVTIGIGKWREAAVIAAAQMGRHTGLSSIVITEHQGAVIEHKYKSTLGEFTVCERGGGTPAVEHPSWLKCHIGTLCPEEKEFLVFDADVLCLHQWDPVGLFRQLGRRFMAVADDNSAPVYHECLEHHLPFPDWYVNGGLTIFGREHLSVWAEVWKRHPRYGRWLEQTALNKALQKTETEVVRLPRSFNYLAHYGKPGNGIRKFSEITNLHFCSVGDPDQIRSLQDIYMMLKVDGREWPNTATA